MVYGIPAASANFVDRADEKALFLRAVDEWQHPSRPLCVALSGVAGIGKTELTYEFARELRERFPDGVLCVDLAELRQGGAVDPADALDKLMRGLDKLPEWYGHSLSDRHKWYRTQTVGRRFTVIIDNARYESELEVLLPASGLSVVMVTSHAPLADLEAGAAIEIPLAPLDERWAMVLLLSAADDPRLTADQDAARELVRLCDGLPLAIHVAARFIRGHRRRSLPALLEAFKGDLREKGLAKVDTIWEAACEALSPGAGRLYRLLADAPGSTFTVYSAAALLGCDPDTAAVALEELEAAALVAGVQDDFGGERMRLPEPVRAHAKRRAHRDGDPGELAEAQRRIVSWYLRQAQLADERTAGRRLALAPRVPPLPGIEDVPFGDAFQWLEAERHVLHACVALAGARGFDTEAWSLCEPLFAHYLDHPHYADVVDALRTGLAAAQRAGYVPAVVQMRCLLARPYWDHGELDEAEREIDLALTASQALGGSDDERKLQASATEARGRLRGIRGNWADAAADFEAALHVHEAIGNEYGVMIQSYRLGEAAARLGDLGRAEELLDRAHRMAERLKRERLTARTGFALADVLRGLGQADRARELYLESLESARARQSHFDQARVLDALAALADETGDAAAAREHRNAAEAIRVRNRAGS